MTAGQRLLGIRHEASKRHCDVLTDETRSTVRRGGANGERGGIGRQASSASPCTRRGFLCGTGQPATGGLGSVRNADGYSGADDGTHDTAPTRPATGMLTAITRSEAHFATFRVFRPHRARQVCADKPHYVNSTTPCSSDESGRTPLPACHRRTALTRKLIVSMGFRQIAVREPGGPGVRTRRHAKAPLDVPMDLPASMWY